MILHETAYCRPMLKRFGKEIAKSAPMLTVENIYNLLKGAVPDEAGPKDRRGLPH